jgi:hypothetical protein
MATQDGNTPEKTPGHLLVQSSGSEKANGLAGTERRRRLREGRETPRRLSGLSEAEGFANTARLAPLVS